MYCSSCGVAVAKGLSYCNFCGTKLNAGSDDSSSRSYEEVRPGLLVSAMAGTFIMGMIAITAFMGVMKVILGLRVESVLVFTLVPFLLMVLLEGVFLRLLMRRQRGTDNANDPVELKGQATKELGVGQAREPVSSVTEHTTRALDPVYDERTSK
jgi:hypothetical protein